MTETHNRTLDRFQQLLRIPTVSNYDPADTEWEHFERYIALLAELYPLIHEHLILERISEYSLLYRWAGQHTAPNPTVFMAHYDVVPATPEGWEYPPFAATVVGSGEDRTIWSRGTLDDKGSMVGILEAVESLLAEGFTPRGDVYLSFGHNEETAGDGAQAIVRTLASRGIRPAFVLDEGGAIVEGVFPGVADPIAVIGVAEKGIMTLRMTVKQNGGHASTPPLMTATVRLARAIVRLNNKPFPAAFSSVNIQMISTLGAHATGMLRFAFTNLWLTRALLLHVFRALGDETRAIVQTTQAVTQLSGSQAHNALAETAEADVNIRIAIGSSVADTIEHVRRAIRDPEVTLTALHPSEPSDVSPAKGPPWQLLQDAVEQVYPGTIVAPYVMLGASDSRHFTAISDNVYRFTPFQMSAEERGTLHARNERIRVSTFLRGIHFYRELLLRGA